MGLINKKLLKTYSEDEIYSEFQEKLSYLIDSVCSKFEKHGIEYSLDSGTLLGYYRDGGVIRGDGDADITVKADDITIDFLKEFSDNFSWNTKHHHYPWTEASRSTATQLIDLKLDNKIHIPVNLEYTEKDQSGKRIKFSGMRKPLYIDIFLLYDAEKLIAEESSDDTEKFLKDTKDFYFFPFSYGRLDSNKSVSYLRIPKYIVDSKKQLTVNNKQYQIYSETEEFLIRRYGESWDIPDPKWHILKSKVSVDDKIMFTEVPPNFFKYQF